MVVESISVLTIRLIVDELSLGRNIYFVYFVICARSRRKHGFNQSNLTFLLDVQMHKFFSKYEHAIAYNMHVNNFLC